jgi:hypothetical protein
MGRRTDTYYALAVVAGQRCDVHFKHGFSLFGIESRALTTVVLPAATAPIVPVG